MIALFLLLVVQVDAKKKRKSRTKYQFEREFLLAKGKYFEATIFGSLTIRGQIRCKTFILQEYESYLMGIKLEKSMKDFLHEFRIEKLEEYFPCYLLFIENFAYRSMIYYFILLLTFL